MSRISRATIVLGRALIGQRNVGTEDTGWIIAIATVLLTFAAIGFIEPRILAWPSAFLLFWVGVASLYRALTRSRDE